MISKKNKENFTESSYIQFETISNEINSNKTILNKFWKKKNSILYSTINSYNFFYNNNLSKFKIFHII